MPNNITIDQLNKIMDLATLHGRIENWVFQTSKGGSQQIKIVTQESYIHNQVNTALRTRARRIMSYAMRTHNPSTHADFAEYIKQTYLNTIYLFYIPDVIIKTKYFNITVRGEYSIYQDSNPDPVFSGVLDPDQSISFQVDNPTQFTLYCYQEADLLHYIEIKMVDEMFDITRFYNKLFNLVNYFVPQFYYEDGMVFIQSEVIFSGTFIEM